MVRLARWLITPALLILFTFPSNAQESAPRQINSTRFTVVFFPGDARLAHAVLRAAVANDTFPWLPRPKEPAVIAIAPDQARFRTWAGADAPEWGAALAFPESHRIVMHGHSASSEAGDPMEVIRHELAHLALHEFMGNAPPRWFDEGYASVSAHEWKRDDVLAANLGLAIRGTPTLGQIDESFRAGSMAAQSAYALSYRAVRELASLDTARGLTLFFHYWKTSRSLDDAVRQAFGMTLSGFEKMFQDRTRRTYGALAVLANLSIVSLVVLLLLLPFIFSRRRRDKERLRLMLAADAASEKAARESALMFLLEGPLEAGEQDLADQTDLPDQQQKNE